MSQGVQGLTTGASPGARPVPKAILPKTSEWAADVSAGFDHVQRPANVCRDRRVAETVVARLIAEAAGHFHPTGRHGVRDIELHANGELVLEDQQWLGLADLLELGRRREDDFGNLDARGRVDCQHSRDQRGVARCVGLDVKSVRDPDLERSPNRGSWCRIRFDQRRQLCSDALKLRDSNLR